MFILGINSAYHEASACLVSDGRVVAAAEEERFTRRKHGKSAQVNNGDELPLNAMRFCLHRAGITMSQVHHVGLSINPQQRLQNKDIVDRVVSGGWGSDSGEKEFFAGLSRVPAALRAFEFDGSVEWIDHHRCHAASAFYVSPFDEAAVLTVDGIGETTSTQLAHGVGTRLTILDEVGYPASLGFIWEKIAKFLGFSEYDACKVMGLAAYGNPARYASLFRELVPLRSDGQFGTNNEVMCFRTEDYAPLEEVFGIARRRQEDALTSDYQDVAAALQEVTNDVVTHIATHLHSRSGSANLCMAGGVALNCVTNRVVLDRTPFTNLFVQPAAHDAGTALGAALLLWHESVGGERREPMGVYLGPSFSDAEIEAELRRAEVEYEHVEQIERHVAELIADGRVVGWFQEGMEFGPRALGNRTLLADPRNPHVRELLNAKVKHRESFRPFGPSVLEEHADEWFDLPKRASAYEYMLVACPVRAHVRERIPAVVHIDGSSRIQIVKRSANPRYHVLISEFYKKTGVPLVLNTSFNDDEPIVCTPADALATFRKTRIDNLALSNFLVRRRGA